MTVAETIALLQQLPAEAIVVVMDYRGNLDEASGAELQTQTKYWPGTHGHPPIKADVVEIS